MERPDRIRSNDMIKILFICWGKRDNNHGLLTYYINMQKQLAENGISEKRFGEDKNEE